MRTIRASLVVVVLLVACVSLGAPQAAVHTVQGTVRVVGTGDPVQGATVVALLGGRGVYRTTTDVDGRYRLALPAGNFLVQAEISDDPDERSISVPLVLRGAFPPQTREIGLGIGLDGSVSGLVRDPDGNPVEGRVSLARIRYRYGRQTIEPFGSARRPDSSGRYELSAPAGQYLVTVATDTGLQYYPGVPFPEAAVPVRVAPGVATTGVHIDLAEIDTFRVSFRFPLPPPPPSLRSVVPIRALVRRLGQGRIESAPVATDLESVGDGGYRTLPLAPGQYEFLLHYSTEVRRELPGLNWRQMDPIARFDVGVVDRDVDLGTIVPPPARTVTGRVLLPPDSAHMVDLIQVPGFSFVDVAYGVPNGIRAFPNANGSFAIEGVAPGLYAFETLHLPSAWPEGWYIASVTAGGRDVLGNGLDVTGASPPIDVVIGGDGARVEGVVRNPNDIPIPRAQVTLIPPNELNAPMTRLFHEWADDSGTFAFEAVPPGNYRIVAFEDLAVPDRMWDDPAFIGSARSLGSSLTLQPGEQRTVDVEVDRRP